MSQGASNLLQRTGGVHVERGHERRAEAASAAWTTPRTRARGPSDRSRQMWARSQARSGSDADSGRSGSSRASARPVSWARSADGPGSPPAGSGGSGRPQAPPVAAAPTRHPRRHGTRRTARSTRRSLSLRQRRPAAHPAGPHGFFVAFASRKVSLFFVPNTAPLPTFRPSDRRPASVGPNPETAVRGHGCGVRAFLPAGSAVVGSGFATLLADRRRRPASVSAPAPIPRPPAVFPPASIHHPPTLGNWVRPPPARGEGAAWDPVGAPRSSWRSSS